MDPFGHVDEGAAGPGRRIQGSELVIVRRDDRGEILLDEVGIIADGRVGIDEDDPLLLQVFPDRVVNDLGFVLGGHTGDQTLLLGFRDPQTVVSVADIGGKLIP